MKGFYNNALNSVLLQDMVSVDLTLDDSDRSIIDDANIKDILCFQIPDSVKIKTDDEGYYHVYDTDEEYVPICDEDVKFKTAHEAEIYVKLHEYIRNEWFSIEAVYVLNRIAEFYKNIKTMGKGSIKEEYKRFEKDCIETYGADLYHICSGITNELKRIEAIKEYYSKTYYK